MDRGHIPGGRELKALRSHVARMVVLIMAAGAVGFGAPVSGYAGVPPCPVGALDRADEPVEITFWHVQQVANEEVLIDLIDQFEASQDRVRVKLVNVPNYLDIFEKYKAAIATGDLPDLVQMDESSIQTLVDSETTIPIGSCVEAADYPLDDFLPQTIDQYTTAGELRAMPWTVSNPVLLYNKNAFRAAGLDPETPPATFDEVTEYSQQLVDAGVTPHGITLRAEPFVNEAFYAKAGELYLNKGNGRDERATKARLNTGVGREIWTWLDDIVASGLGLFTGSRQDNFDNLFALGTGDAAMTIDTSNVIESSLDVIESGEFEDVDLGVGQLPSINEGGGVPVGDGSLWIPATGSKARQAASWALVEFLSAPEQQAEYSVGTRGGFIPIRRSAIDDPALQAMWAEEPDLRVPYEQLEAGAGQDATLGAVTGDFAGVRAAVRDALTAMFADELSAGEALARAQREATTAIQDYNERLGL
jgi:sn-glycerol 3-phosphate transport system substrate-binding protein